MWGLSTQGSGYPDMPLGTATPSDLRCSPAGAWAALTTPCLAGDSLHKQKNAIFCPGRKTFFFLTVAIKDGFMFLMLYRAQQTVSASQRYAVVDGSFVVVRHVGARANYKD